MSEKIKISIILGSTRDGRFGEMPANLVKEMAEKLENTDVELLDLKEIDLPNFKSAVSPAYITNKDYGNEKVNSFADKIRESDAFVFVTPEYNRGYSAAIKNAIDSIYLEWNNKAVACVSYGSVGGARAMEQLRQVAIELQMAPIRNGVHIFAPWNLVNEDGKLKDGALEPYKSQIENMLSQLVWWAGALKKARNS